MKTLFIFVGGLLLGAACTTALTPTDATAERRALLNAHIADFNRHDPAALANNLVDEFGWYQIQAGDLSVEAQDKAALIEGLQSYFAAVPSVSSNISDTLHYGSFVATVETVSWQANEKRRSQSALSVYEFDGNKIKHVWYFPAATVD